jgi:transcription elongation factor Elf1
MRIYVGEIGDKTIDSIIRKQVEKKKDKTGEAQQGATDSSEDEEEVNGTVMMDAYKHFVDVLKDKTTEQFESEDSSDDETEQRRRIESTDTAESG